MPYCPPPTPLLFEVERGGRNETNEGQTHGLDGAMVVPFIYIDCDKARKEIVIVISAKSTNFTTNTRYHVDPSVDEPHRLQQRVLV